MLLGRTVKSFFATSFSARADRRMSSLPAVTVALPTPFAEDGGVDVHGLRREARPQQIRPPASCPRLLGAASQVDGVSLRATPSPLAPSRQSGSRRTACALSFPRAPLANSRD